MSIESIGESEEVPSFEYEKSYREFLAESVTKVASACIFPFWTVQQSLHSSFLPLHSGEYGQSRSNVQEAVMRLFWGLFIKGGAFLTSLPFAGFGVVLTGIGNLLHTKPYRTDKGTFHGEMSKNAKLMVLNPRMLAGGLPYVIAGLMPASDRLDRLVSTIRDNNPDIVFLSEVNASIRSSLRYALSDRYHYFFSNMGRRTLGMDASFFIAFRGELKKAPQFIPYKSQDLVMERGFFTFETADTVYFCTYRPSLDDLKEICERKVEEKKVALVGDMAFERNSLSFQYLEKQGFVSGLKEGTPTETNAPYLHLYQIEEDEKKMENGVVFLKGKGESKATPSHLDSKIDEALSNQSFILTNILA